MSIVGETPEEALLRCTMVDVSDHLIAPADPFWLLSLPNDRAGDIIELERFVAGALTLDVDVMPGLPLAYKTEVDARRCAIGMMWLRPELEVGIASSDPSAPGYVPIAHTIVRITAETK